MALPAFVNPTSKNSQSTRFKKLLRDKDLRDEAGPFLNYIIHDKPLPAGLKRMPSPFNPVPSIITGAGGPKVKKLKAKMRKKGKKVLKNMLKEAMRRPNIMVGTRLKAAPASSI